MLFRSNEGMEEKLLKFDLRAYSLQGVSGIRIRYAGLAFNPFQRIRKGNSDYVMQSMEEDELYMGISMIRKMVEDIHYQRTLGVNTLQVLIREEPADGGN